MSGLPGYDAWKLRAPEDDAPWADDCGDEAFHCEECGDTGWVNGWDGNSTCGVFPCPECQKPCPDIEDLYERCED